MTSPPRPPGRAALGSMALIALVVALAAGAFAYTAGWLSPRRLTPDKLVASLAPPAGPALGHRRNHVKGICFIGEFDANGAGAELSKAAMLARGQYPVVGRFNLGTPDPTAPDGSVRVRGIGLQISAPGGQVWRSAMIDLPFFPVATPQAFYTLQRTAGLKSPEAMKAFVEQHPEFANFLGWAKAAPWTGSYAEETYNSLNSFTFVNASGARSVVRWSLLPAATITPIAPDVLAKQPPSFLNQEITQRIQGGPLRWTLAVTVAAPGDPTADPSKAWPKDRRTVEVGSLVVQRIVPEPNGPCRDINFDPTVLPAGVATSDDPFPAARSAAYRRSYDLRTAEEKYYPHTASEGQQ